MNLRGSFPLRFWPVGWPPNRICFRPAIWPRFHCRTYRPRPASSRCPWRIACRWYRRRGWCRVRPCSRRQWWFWSVPGRQCPRSGAWRCSRRTRRCGSWSLRRWWGGSWVGGGVPFAEDVVWESEEETALSDGGVADEQQLEEVVVVLVHRLFKIVELQLSHQNGHKWSAPPPPFFYFLTQLNLHYCHFGLWSKSYSVAFRTIFFDRLLIIISGCGLSEDHYQISIASDLRMNLN